MAKRPKTIAKTFEINLQPWNGIITSQDSFTIPEDTAVWVSGLPKLTGAIENVPAPMTVYTHSSTIKFAFGFELSGNRYYCIMDGSSLVFLSSSFTAIASFPTADTVCDYAIQDNQYIWITTKNFLITFDGNNLYNLTSYGITGDSIAYWKGRIFIGKNRVLTFSKPDPAADGSANPFDIEQGAGAITLTVSIFSKIYAIVPKEDSIYLFTDRSIISLIGTTISNDPTLWYITELLKDIGITGIRRYALYEHSIYFHSLYGLQEIVATSPNKIDDAITNITRTVNSIAIFSYKQVTYVAAIAPSYVGSGNAIYCYNLLLKKWYTLDISAESIFSIANDAFIVSGRAIQKLFANTVYLPLYIKSKIFFSIDNTYFNIKNIVIYGRGVYNYASPFTVMVYAQEQDNIIFTNTSNNLLSVQQTGSEQGSFGSEDFWIAVLKPADTNPFQMRVKQFQIQFNQIGNDYSEIINIRVNGTIGARYV